MRVMAHFGILGNDVDGAQSLVEALMRQEDLVSNVPVTFYSRHVRVSGDREIACNLWYLGDTCDSALCPLAWDAVNCWIWLVDLADPNCCEHIETIWQGMREEETEGYMVVIGAYRQRSTLTNTMREQLLVWCAEHDDPPFLEIDRSRLPTWDDEKWEVAQEWVKLIDSVLSAT